ncbi:MAG: hypothetical protein DRN66_01440 [Candidatus Nanohalarchaeota archaeon]|nr:MAG: hypothetical protein DRN66_01440 [Candidatus Nanohaloarchaeota archaeon]
MGEKYILIVAKEQNGKNVLTEHIAEMKFLMKVEKGGKRTKIPYNPSAYNPGVELVNFINKKYPDMKFLITGTPLRFGNNLKNGENVTFAPWTTVDEIAEKCKCDQIYSNQVPILKNTASHNEADKNTIVEMQPKSNDIAAIAEPKPKNKSSGDWLLFIIILIIVLVLVYYSGDITPGLEGLDLGSIVNIK